MFSSSPQSDTFPSTSSPPPRIPEKLVRSPVVFLAPKLPLQFRFVAPKPQVGSPASPHPPLGAVVFTNVILVPSCGWVEGGGWKTWRKKYWPTSRPRYRQWTRNGPSVRARTGMSRRVAMVRWWRWWGGGEVGRMLGYTSSIASPWRANQQQPRRRRSSSSPSVRPKRLRLSPAPAPFRFAILKIRNFFGSRRAPVFSSHSGRGSCVNFGGATGVGVGYFSRSPACVRVCVRTAYVRFRRGAKFVDYVSAAAVGPSLWSPYDHSSALWRGFGAWKGFVVDFRRRLNVAGENVIPRSKICFPITGGGANLFFNRR